MSTKIIFVLAVIAATVLAQTSRSVWDGVYTEAQAKRGEAIYEQNCVSCHGPALMEKHPHFRVVNLFGPGMGSR